MLIKKAAAPEFDTVSIESLKTRILRLPQGVGYLGIDPSYACTGFCYLARGVLEHRAFRPKSRGILRLAEIAEEVRRWLVTCQPTLVILEGYGFDSMKATSMGEVGGQVRLQIVQHGAPCYTIAPNSLKLFITGDGRADKDKMESHCGYDFKAYPKGTRNDVVDAAGLALCGVALHTGLRLELKYRLLS